MGIGVVATIGDIVAIVVLPEVEIIEWAHLAAGGHDPGDLSQSQPRRGCPRSLALGDRGGQGLQITYAICRKLVFGLTLRRLVIPHEL